MDKEQWYNEVLLSHRRDEMRPLAAIWMNLQIVMLNEVSQTEKHKISCDIAYMWNIKKWYKGIYL